MVMVVVDLAVADAVLVPLMMIVHGGETNRKFQLEEILEKKDQNDQNLTFYQEANRLMKIQVCSIDRSGSVDGLRSSGMTNFSRLFHNFIFLDSSPAQKGSNPFGAARPIDTSAKEKEIEQKLKETHIRDQPNKPRDQRKEPVKKV